MVYCDSTIHVEDARGRGNRLVHTRGIESIHICRLLASKHTMQYELMVVHSGINQTYFHSTRIPSEIFWVVLRRVEVTWRIREITLWRIIALRVKVVNILLCILALWPIYFAFQITALILFLLPADKKLFYVYKCRTYFFCL